MTEEEQCYEKWGYHPGTSTLDYPTKLVTILFLPPPPFFLLYGNIILMGGKWKILHDFRDSCTPEQQLRSNKKKKKQILYVNAQY